MFVSEKMDGALFMISLITYPADYNTSNTRQLLRDVIDEMVKSNQDNTLNSIKDTKFLNFSAFDFNVTNKDYGVDGKAFIQNKTIYLLTYIAKNSAFDEKEYQHFLDSFQLTNPEKNEKK